MESDAVTSMDQYDLCTDGIWKKFVCIEGLPSELRRPPHWIFSRGV